MSVSVLGVGATTVVALFDIEEEEEEEWWSDSDDFNFEFVGEFDWDVWGDFEEDDFMF